MGIYLEEVEEGSMCSCDDWMIAQRGENEQRMLPVEWGSQLGGWGKETCYEPPNQGSSPLL